MNVYSRLNIVYQDPFLDKNLIWKSMRVDQIHCQDRMLRAKDTKFEDVKRDCVIIYTDDTFTEGHQRYQFAQTHLFFEFEIDGKHY
jgi:hypothetical protein